MIHEHAPERESYQHMMGTPKRAHEGSQSKHPTEVFGGAKDYPSGHKAPKFKERGNPSNLPDADE